jgi:hypothetical protein
MMRPDDQRDSVMPAPIWRAQSRAYPIYMLLNNGSRANQRPLEPGERRLGWFILPPFQRAAVWTEAQRVRFIESIWLDLPISVYAFCRCDHESQTDTWLIDGQQRIGAVLAYAAGEFSVRGYRYGDLPIRDIRRFENKVFPAIELDETDPAVLADIYDRLAYGGTPHQITNGEGA